MTKKSEPLDPQRLLPMRPPDFQVLLILADGDLHAYGISKAVEKEPSGGVRLEIGSLYRMLARMLTAGLIEEPEHRRAGNGREARRRYYRITRFGRRVAEAEARRLRDVIELARKHKFLPDPHGG